MALWGCGNMDSARQRLQREQRERAQISAEIERLVRKRRREARRQRPSSACQQRDHSGNRRNRQHSNTSRSPARNIHVVILPNRAMSRGHQSTSVSPASRRRHERMAQRPAILRRSESDSSLEMCNYDAPPPYDQVVTPPPSYCSLKFEFSL